MGTSHSQRRDGGSKGISYSEGRVLIQSKWGLQGLLKVRA